MADRTGDSRRKGTLRHAATVAVFLLLPLLMLVGMLAPAAIQVQQEETQDAVTAWTGPLAFRPLSKRPLLVPRDFSAGFVPELVDIESLFVGPRYRAQESQRISSLPSFPASQGDTIVLDEVDAYVAEQVFDDSLEPVLTVDLTPLWNPAVFDIIPPLIPLNGERQFDDFVGGGDLVLPTDQPPVPVPEPATAALLALGLAGLALLRRR